MGVKRPANDLSAKVKNECSLDVPPRIWLHSLHKIFAHTCMVPVIYIYYNFTRIYSFSPVSLCASCLSNKYIRTYIHICTSFRRSTNSIIQQSDMKLVRNNTEHTNKTNEHNTINKCQYYRLQNQILCTIFFFSFYSPLAGFSLFACEVS